MTDLIDSKIIPMYVVMCDECGEIKGTIRCKIRSKDKYGTDYGYESNFCLTCLRKGEITGSIVHIDELDKAVSGENKMPTLVQRKLTKWEV